jgi:hypothetical protein
MSRPKEDVSDDDLDPTSPSERAPEPADGPPQMSRASALGWWNPFAPDHRPEDFEGGAIAGNPFD